MRPSRTKLKNWEFDEEFCVYVHKYQMKLNSGLPRYLPSQDSTHTRHDQLLKVMLKASEAARKNPTEDAQAADPLGATIQELITERRALRNGSHPACDMPARRQPICKDSQNLIPKSARLKIQIEIAFILKDFHGLKDIAGIRTGRCKTGISAMRDTGDSITTDKQGIADVLSDFCQTLCAATGDRNVLGNPTRMSAAFALSELCSALKTMRRGRAHDASGIVAEILKDGTGSLPQANLEFFNDVLAFPEGPSQIWKHILSVNYIMEHQGADHAA